MKIVANRSDWLAAISKCSGLIERRNTIPILDNIRIEAKADTVTLTATNLDQMAVATFPAQIEKAGLSTVSGLRLQSIIQNAPEGCQVSMEVADGVSHCSFGRSKFKLNTLPADDFPVFKEIEKPLKFSLRCSDLLKALTTVASAQCEEQSRYYLCGVCVSAAAGTPLGGAGGLRFVATNGHIALYAALPLPEGAAELERCTLPGPAIAHLIKILGDQKGAEEVQIGASQARWSFEFPALIYQTKTIDGSFPDADRIVPTSNETTVIVNAPALAAALRRAVLVSTDKTRSVTIDMNEDRMMIICQSDTGERSEEEIPCAFAGEPMRVGANVRYVSDMLVLQDKEEIQLSFRQSTDPVLIRGHANEGDQFGVLMPIRISS